MYPSLMLLYKMLKSDVNESFESMKMIPFKKSLKMSISLHFTSCINSYIHTFICNTSMSIDILKKKNYWKSTSFSTRLWVFLFTKRTMQFPLVILTHRILNIFRLNHKAWKRSGLPIQYGKRISCKMKEMGNEQRNFSQMMDFHIQPSLINPKCLKAIVGPRAKFRETLYRSIYGTEFRWPLWTKKVI